jgi:hypothetical protein
MKSRERENVGIAEDNDWRRVRGTSGWRADRVREMRSQRSDLILSIKARSHKRIRGEERDEYEGWKRGRKKVRDEVEGEFMSTFQVVASTFQGGVSILRSNRIYALAIFGKVKQPHIDNSVALKLQRRHELHLFSSK